jgi:polysaccharide export outer membrane protein
MPSLETDKLSSQPLEPLIVTLGPDDVIDVKFLYWPELDETQTVRPDGKISLQLIDDVQVAGLTPKRLDDELTKLYEGQIKDPVITVIVRSLVNRRVYVAGAVKSPGLVPIRGSMTALEAVMSAGGANESSADLSSVVVIQQAGDKRYAALVDLKSALENPESYQYFLGPNDIVYVPRTRIVKLNEWVSQHINQVVPDTGINWGITTRGVNSTRTLGITPGRN